MRIFVRWESAGLAAGLLLLSGCGGVSSSKGGQSGSGAPTPPIAVPSQPAPTFFGMHQSHLAGCNDAPLNFTLFDVPAGAFRAWSTCHTQWQQMNPANGQYDFSGLDNLLNALHIKGINDVFVSLGSTPNWISSNPTDMDCDRADVNGQPPGMCDPPADLNSDGTGTDLAWRTFVTVMLQHVTANGYSSNHAHLQFYSIWDEFHRSDTLNTTSCYPPGSPQGDLTCSFRGTFAQMLRMTQDLRCIVEGHPNDPITATGLTCGNSNYTQIGIDPTAQIMEGDAGGEELDNGNTVMQNYLFCNANPPPNSMCNYGDAGYAATDVISGHSYFQNGHVPEDTIKYIVKEEQLDPNWGASGAKLYITGEGSWGKNANSDGSPGVSNADLQAAFLARWYLSLLIAGSQRGYWYAWDDYGDDGSGGLWSPTSVSFPPLQCTTSDPNIGGYYCSGAVAYIQTVNWLSDATATTVVCPGSCTNPAPGVYILNLTRSNGYQATVMWDSTPTTSCSNPQCGAIAIAAAPPFTVAQWRDVAGATHSGAPASIGAAPIILENMAAP